MKILPDSLVVVRRPETLKTSDWLSLFVGQELPKEKALGRVEVI
jgi:hypothetical protein